VMEAWYPGQEGGTAIAEVLTGAINPSGRLPITFPASLDQYPRRDLPGFGLPDRTAVDVQYSEGAEAGYRAFARSGQRPLFSFGHGLSYTTFTHTGLKAHMGKSLELSLTVRNVGRIAGADVPQLYLMDSNGTRRQRLVGFQRVALAPGESREVRVLVDPRLIAIWTGKGWTQAKGNYRFAVGTSAADLGDQVSISLTQRHWKGKLQQ
jgi:beta-glucosidase